MPPEARDLLRSIGRAALEARDEAGRNLAIADRQMRLGHCLEAGSWIRSHMRSRGEADGLAMAARTVSGGGAARTSRPRWQKALSDRSAEVIRRHEDACTSMHDAGEDLAAMRKAVRLGFRSLRLGDCEGARRALDEALAPHRRLDRMWSALLPLDDEPEDRLRETGPRIRQSMRRMETALSNLSSTFDSHCVPAAPLRRFGGPRRRKAPLLEF